VAFYEYGSQKSKGTLISFLDAANGSSYPGSGTAWTDLLAFQNATLVNGTSFNSSNGGSIQFDGVNDYASMSTKFNYTTQDFSFSIWVFVTSLTTNIGGQGPFLFSKGSFGSEGYYCQINSGGVVNFVTNSPAGVGTSTAAIISAGNWYNITTTRKGASVKIYVNGVDSTSVTSAHVNPLTSTWDFRIAAYGPGIFSNIRVAKFQSYTGAMSAAQVVDNFNLYRSIYGL
jgi:hypothetical protein